MNLQNSYWYFRGVIKPEICDRIIEMGKSKCTKLGQVNKKSPKELEDLNQKELDDLLKKEPFLNQLNYQCLISF